MRLYTKAFDMTCPRCKATRSCEEFQCNNCGRKNTIRGHFDGTRYQSCGCKYCEESLEQGMGYLSFPCNKCGATITSKFVKKRGWFF